MNYNRNEKIKQITQKTLVVGIDIAKHKHVARAQDDRGVDLGKRLIFENNINGFERLTSWLSEHMETHDKTKVILGVEPTGHYWLNLAYFAKAREIPFVVVNPMHAKKWKELNDNSPSKNDTKDARVTGQLVKDGRYSIPNLLEGVHEKVRRTHRAIIGNFSKPPRGFGRCTLTHPIFKSVLHYASIQGSALIESL
jgi:transposase